MGRIDLRLTDGTLIDRKAWLTTPSEGQVQGLDTQASKYLNDTTDPLVLEFKYGIHPDVQAVINQLQADVPGRVRATAANR